MGQLSINKQDHLQHWSRWETIFSDSYQFSSYATHQITIITNNSSVKMAGCFSFTSTRDSCYRFSFSNAGLKSSTVDLKDGTVIHSWVPRTHKPNKPTLCFIHGIGANAMWQWADVIAPLVPKFNVYVPDLLFFGESYTTRPERTESFQARCLMGLLEAHGVSKAPISLVGISYGGFVAYSMAAQFSERIERAVLICAGVSMEEKDMDEGLFKVKSVDEATEVLFPQSPESMKKLLTLTFYKPPKNIPSCFFNDYINVMCREHLQERKELIHALHKGKNLSDLPKINQVYIFFFFFLISKIGVLLGLIDFVVLAYSYDLGRI